MANVTRRSSAVAQLFLYARDLLGNFTLTNPSSLSTYVYNPSNQLIYTDNRPQYSLSTGVYNTFIPSDVLTISTAPETYYQIVTVAQFVDGRIQEQSQNISVE